MKGELAVRGLHSFLINQSLGIIESGNILDIGCGTGAWLKRLRGLGYKNLTGIDKESPEDLPFLRFIQHDLNDNISYEHDQFQFISCIEVIEHIDNPGNIFRIVAKLLAPNGRFLLTSPNVESLEARARFFLNGNLPHFDSKSNPEHIFPLLQKTVDVLAARYGLSIERSFSYSGPMFSWGIRLAAKLTRAFLGDENPGDINCWILKKNKLDGVA